MRRSAAWLVAGTSLLLVALAVGYLAFTGAGRELVRIEVERFLGDLLEGAVQIDEVELVFSGGLGLRGLGVSVYPDDGGPGMHADSATIELSGGALLLGDVKLSALVVDGLVIRARLHADGSWSYPPLQLLQNRLAETDADAQVAPVLAALAGAETVGRYILEKEAIAATLVIHNGSILFEDHSLTADTRPEMGLQRFELRQIEARVRRPLLSNEANFTLSGTFAGPGGNSCPVTWTGSIRDGRVELELSVEDLDLDALDGYIQRLSSPADIDGSLAGSVHLETAQPGFQQVVFDARLTDFAPTLVLDGKPIHVDLAAAHFHARLEVEPGVARVLDAEFSGPRVSLELEGHLERPLSRRSRAHLEIDLHGIAVEDVGPIVEQLPEESLDTLREWFGRLTSGTVDRLAVSGTTSLATWEALANGELSRLPRNFLLRLDVTDVAVALDDGDQIVGATFAASWAGDRLEIRNADGTWRGEDLAEITITVDGISRLIGMEEFAGEVSAMPTPGLTFLWDQLFARDQESPSQEAPRRFLVDVDYLDHPILRWPIENAQVVVQPTATGSESQVTSALWGGRPVVAELLYQLHPVQRITVGLSAQARPEDGKRPDPHPREAGIWGRARFRLEPADDSETAAPGLLSRMSGEIELRGSSVELSNVEVALSSATIIAADLSIDLGKDDRLAVQVTGAIEDSSCDDLGQAIGLPAGFITGTLDVTADLSGEIVRGEGFFDRLEGTITVAAEEGEIRQSIPLAVALSTATDGFNPFAKRESLRYETIQADILLAGGLLTAERLELEGPVRIYATGTLNFAEPPREVDAVVGVFLLQRIREFLDKVPIVNLVLPGSSKGFVGAYMRVQGPWDDPEVTTMAMKSLKEELPDLFTKPFDLIQSLWSDGEKPPDEKTHKDKAVADKAAAEPAAVVR